MHSASSYPLWEDSFMNYCKFLDLTPDLMVTIPVTADMYCDMNAITGGDR